MVRAWATANRLTLGQVRTTAPANEITAIPQLLPLPDLRGCLAAIAARGGQKASARQSVAGEADCRRAVKGNQGQLYANLPDAFRGAEGSDRCREVGKGQGRGEVRPGRVSADREELAYSDPAGEGPSLSSVAQVSYERRSGVTATEQRYYRCSRPLSAADFRQSVRAPWGIANRRHWVLAGAFDAEHCRGRTDNAPANLSAARPRALNRLRQENSRKVGIQAKRKRAGWD